MSDKNIYTIVSKNILTLRREKGITQEEMASRLNTSQAFIHQIESCKKTVNLRQINDIAISLGCSLYDLIPEKPIQNNKDNL